MHEDQLEIPVATVVDLVRTQLPQWADEPVTQVRSHGTVNALFRIGSGLVARFPISGGDAEEMRAHVQAEMDAARMLGRVAPVATPEPLASGEPGCGYPLPWAVYRWIPGTIADQTDVSGSPRFGEQVADFVRAVRSLPTDGRSFAGTGRGGSLTDHDGYVARGLLRSQGMIDTAALADLWRRLRTTARSAPDTWTHGDLMPGNLLVAGRDLAGVIDVGQLGVADPALDLQPAWNLLTARGRAAFRDRLECDDDEWDRGKGWAFAQAIGSLWYYRDTNPVMSRTAHTTLQALLYDAAEGDGAEGDGAGR